MKNIIVILLLILFYHPIYSQSCVIENYYLYEGKSISNGKPFWLPTRTEVQGIANDGESWFITTVKFLEGNQNHNEVSGSRIWKIPKEVHLGAGSSNNLNIKSVVMDEVPDFVRDSMYHFGDLDSYSFEGIDYLVVPITGPQGKIIACYEAKTLRFISYASGITGGFGWCAIDPDGYLYTSAGASLLRKFKVDWEKLTTGDPQHNSISKLEDIQLTFPNRNYTGLSSWQGGEFSPSGKLLYVTTGSAGGCVPCLNDCNGCNRFFDKKGPGEPRPSDGIHVFETSTWSEIKTSTKEIEQLFSFDFDNDITGEQPQGITIWDLEDEDTPDEIRGKLHVLMHDWDWDLFTNNHEVSLYHYSNVINVDSDYNGIIRFSTGSTTLPFKFFNNAFYKYPDWNGSEIRLKSGVYDEIGIYDKCVLLTSEGGSAIIGKQ